MRTLLHWLNPMFNSTKAVILLYHHSKKHRKASLCNISSLHLSLNNQPSNQTINPQQLLHPCKDHHHRHHRIKTRRMILIEKSISHLMKDHGLSTTRCHSSWNRFTSKRTFFRTEWRCWCKKRKRCLRRLAWQAIKLRDWMRLKRNTRRYISWRQTVKYS